MRLIFTALLMAVAPLLSANAQEAPDTGPVSTAVTLEVGKRFQIQSAILGESRDILVRLPVGYEEGENSYPVIYVLDGNNHFFHASIGAGLLEENDRMPESIIVALPNGDGTRGRDLAREMDNFRRFIGEEVFAFVDANYRTSGQKSLFGHSLAGFFTLTMLVDHSDMFDAYIAASPVVQARNSELIAKFEKLFEAKPALKKALYLTLTDAAEEGLAATDALNQLVKLLEEKAPQGLVWRYDFIGAQVHMTTPALTAYQGLSYVFTDYQAPSFVSVDMYKAAGGMPAFKERFVKRGAKYGRESQIPQETMRRLAYLHMREGLHDDALTLFSQNQKNFPESPRIYNSLGDGYDAAGMTEDALKAYKKAAALAEAQASPNVNFFKRQVARIEEKLAD